MRKRELGYFLAVCGLAVVLSGCAVQHTVPLATRTPTSFGNIKLYGTDNVPFEYEELASLSQAYDMDPYTEEESLRLFAAKAQEVGADAILNFRMESLPGTGGFFFVASAIGPRTSYLSLSGTAVKIKRP